DALDFALRVVVDFADDDGADFGRRVGGVEGESGHRHKVFVGLAVEVASEGDAGFAGVEVVAVMVAGEFARAVGGVEVGFVAGGTEGEARRRSGSWVEVVFVEADVAATG